MSRNMKQVGRKLAGSLHKRLAGRVIVGRYPAANHVGKRPRLEVRRIYVERVRDLRAHPLRCGVQVYDPCRRRGRILLAGFDMATGQACTMFLSNFTNWTIRDYREEAAATKPPAAIMIDVNGHRSVRWCGQFQGGYASAARESHPEAVVYPISAAI